jgi:hypothetical protein
MRQPEVERELRAFGERAREDQHEQQRIEPVRPDRGARCENDIEVVTPHDVADDQHAGKQA